MKSAEATPFSATSVFVVTRSAISGVVETECAFGSTIAGASCGCDSSFSVIDGVALGEGAGDVEGDALGESEACGV
jgi:hypothetical protein